MFWSIVGELDVYNEFSAGLFVHAWQAPSAAAVHAVVKNPVVQEDGVLQARQVLPDL